MANDINKTKTYFPPEPKIDTTEQLEKKFLQPTRSECYVLQKYSYYPFLVTKTRWPLSFEEAGSKKKKTFFCLRDWGGDAPPPKTVGGQIYNTIERRNLVSTNSLVDNIFAGVKVLK